MIAITRNVPKYAKPPRRDRHTGDVEIALAPAAILRLARASLKGLSTAEQRLLTRRLVEPAGS